MRSRRLLSFAITTLFSLAVIAYVVCRLDWAEVSDVYRRLNGLWLLFAWSVFLLTYVLRALRFRSLIGRKGIPFRQLLAVTQLHGMYVYLMPASSGDVSLPILLNRRLQIPMSESIAVLVAVRFLDLAANAAFVLIVLACFAPSMPAGLIYACLVFGSLILVGGVVIVWLLRRPSRQHATTDVASSNRLRWLARLQKVWQDLVHTLRLIDQRGDYRQLILLTVAIWLCVYINFYGVVNCIGYALSLVEVAVVSIVIIPMTLLPIQGFASLGTYEASWVAAFALFGYPAELALAAAVGTHVILLGFALSLGIAAALLGIRAPIPREG